MIANLPRGTEVATDKGFIPIERYRGERLVVVEGRLEASFQSAYHLAKDYHEGWMVQVGGEGLKLIAKPEQSIACSTWVNGGGYMWPKNILEIEDVGSTLYCPVAVDSFSQPEMDITDDELSLSALISIRLTEVNAKSYRLEFCRKPEAELIMTLCDRLGIPSHKTDVSGYVNVFIDKHKILANIFTVFPSNILSSLSKRQMQLVLDVIGSCASDVRKYDEAVFAWSIDPWVIDVLSIMAILCGHKVQILRKDRKVKYFPKTYKTVKPIIIKCHRTPRENLRLYVKVRGTKIVDYSGEVYSLYVPRGYIVVRQDRGISMVYAAKD